MGTANSKICLTAREKFRPLFCYTGSLFCYKFASPCFVILLICDLDVQTPLNLPDYNHRTYPTSEQKACSENCIVVPFVISDSPSASLFEDISCLMSDLAVKRGEYWP